MKKTLEKFLGWILLFALILCLIPSLVTRVENESLNNNVTVSILYNNLKEKVTKEKLDSQLNDYLNAGITTVSVMEEDINALVSAGELTCIKYNVLLHKYDDESITVGNAIAERCPHVTLDSHIILAKRDAAKEKLSYHLPRRYTSDDYMYIGEVENMDIYVFFDSYKQLWDFALGYDEEDLAYLYSKGFDIALIHKVKNYSNQEYLLDLDRLVKTYGVKYLNIKKDTQTIAPGEKEYKDNYKGITKIILDNYMTLVVTENEDQLSNQRCFGYNYIFDEVVKKHAPSRVIRAYETYDDSHSDDTKYKHRVSQLFNSTIDRNIRFVTITQIVVENTSFTDLADYTYKAATEYTEKIAKHGFTVNEETKSLDYAVGKSLTYALCASLMVIAVYLMLKLVFNIKDLRFTLVCVVIAAIGFVGTMLLPTSLSSLLNLYPTVYCVVMSCFAITVTLVFMKSFKEKLPVIPFILISLVTMMAALLIGSIGMGGLLSGIDYYINNDIFRGIKLSLLVPVAYTAILFYILFIKNEKSNILRDVFKLLNADIKVYWLILGGIVAGVGIYYIIRSGNVSEISGFESLVRNKLTELFAERPRTKEFLIGYPSLILLGYYFKKTNLKLIQWLLAIAASILAASVTNSFCHVFTNYLAIVTRTLNGLIIGIIIAAVLYVVNLAIVKFAVTIKTKLDN